MVALAAGAGIGAAAAAADHGVPCDHWPTMPECQQPSPGGTTPTSPGGQQPTQPGSGGSQPTTPGTTPPTTPAFDENGVPTGGFSAGLLRRRRRAEIEVTKFDMSKGIKRARLWGVLDGFEHLPRRYRSEVEGIVGRCIVVDPSPKLGAGFSGNVFMDDEEGQRKVDFDWLRRADVVVVVGRLQKPESWEKCPGSNQLSPTINFVTKTIIYE